ncbi:CHAT domain containing protein [Rhypophila decipiens]
MAHLTSQDIQGPEEQSKELQKDAKTAPRLYQYDRNEPIDNMKQAVDDVPDDRSRAEDLNLLAHEAFDIYDKTGVIAELDASIDAARQAIDMTPDNQDRAGYLNDLGTFLLTRYQRAKTLATLDAAIQVFEQAVEIGPHPRYPALYLNDLAISLRERYSKTKQKSDLERSMEMGRRALEATSVDTSETPGPDNLRIVDADGNSTSAGIFEIDDEVALARQEVCTAGDGPDRVTCLTYLGFQLQVRFSRTGNLADLEEAVEVARMAVDSRSDKQSTEIHMRSLVALENVLGRRYSRTGKMADLEESLRIAGQLLDDIGPDDPKRADYLDSLGAGLAERYARTWARFDLDERIRVARLSAGMDPNVRANRAGRLHNLGSALLQRHSRTGTATDLDEAIQLGRQAVDLTPVSDPQRPTYLTQLVDGLRLRYVGVSWEMSDLEEAIQLAEQAIEITAENSSADLATRMHHLVMLLCHRYKNTHTGPDHKRATELARRVVDMTPSDNPERATYLHSLGSRLCERYQTYSGKGEDVFADLQEALSCFRSAVEQRNSATMDRIQAGAAALKLCTIADLNPEAVYEIASLTVSLIPQLALRSLESADKQHVLANVVGLASDAAAAALHAGKGALTALEFLEQGRGILATSLREMRTDVHDLRDRYPELADKFSRLREELDAPATYLQWGLLDGGEPSQSGSWEARTNRRYEAGKEFDRVVDEIRRLPGLKEFLRPPSEADHRAAATCGPIVIINVSQRRCDAILVEQHQTRALALTGLFISDIEEKLQGGNPGSHKILQWLWDAVAGPVLNALGFDRPPTDGIWPRIWWVPTGPLTKFPIHAAGHHARRSSETVLDRAMSSYSPSIKAIIHGRRHRAPPADTLASAPALLIAMEVTPGQSRLPHATAEITALREICTSMGLLVVEPPRRKQDVLSHLREPGCAIFHFAGHGYTDDSDPSQSYLCLEDGSQNPLRVADLLEMNLAERSPFLAYLSACGTSSIRGGQYLDESIHLASACVLAGFRHVIGTLWEVKDKLCVDIAQITYQVMRDAGMADESVCAGLHRASLELRDRWLATRPSEKARQGQGKGQVREARTLETDMKSPPRGAPPTDQGSNSRKPRTATEYESDHEDGEQGLKEVLLWVPYVHFGV